MRWAELAALGVAVGIAVSGNGQLVAGLVLGLGALGLLARVWERAVLVLALAVLLGASSAAWHRDRQQCDALAGADGLAVDVSGTVLEAPRRRARGLAFVFLAERFEGRPELVPQKLFVELDRPLDVAAGDRWRFRGRLQAPRQAAYPGGFDQGSWLRRQGVRHRLPVSRWHYANRLGPPPGWGFKPLVYQARNRILDSLARGLEGKVRSLVAGIVLGESQGLDPPLQEAFRRTGTTHLLAASGLNVAIVMGLVFLVAGRLGFGRHRAALPAALAVWFYAYLAGASPSVVRAATMASVVLLAMGVGRVTDLRHSLGLAVSGLLLLEPAYLEDIGFQLSVVAVVGIGTLSSGLTRRLEGLPSWLASSLAVTCAATLAVLPVLAWHFQSVSPTTLLANLAMAPAAELLLPVGLLTAVLPLAPLFWACRALASYLVVCAETISGWADPWNLVRPDGLLLFLFAGAFGLVYLLICGRWRVGLAVALVLAALGLCWRGPQPPPAGLVVARVVRFGGADVVWARQAPDAEVVWLSDPQARDRATEMLLIHRVARFRMVTGGSSERLEFPRGLVVDGAGVQVRGKRLDLGALPAERPLEVVCNGERCWVGGWGSEES